MEIHVTTMCEQVQNVCMKTAVNYKHCPSETTTFSLLSNFQIVQNKLLCKCANKQSKCEKRINLDV